MITLGISLSINNARAVLEGLFGGESEFVRTPKHGVVAANQSWTKKKYKATKNLATLVELGFGLYFITTIGIAIATGSWMSIPFLFLFMVGFLYVGGLSLFQAR
jgi:hypothetical protein